MKWRRRYGQLNGLPSSSAPKVPRGVERDEHQDVCQTVWWIACTSGASFCHHLSLVRMCWIHGEREMFLCGGLERKAAGESSEGESVEQVEQDTLGVTTGDTFYCTRAKLTSPDS
jgi:hypothetical protein